MKNLVIIPLLLAANLAVASDGIKVKPKGRLQAEMGARTQTNVYGDAAPISPNNKDIVFKSSANVSVKATGKVANSTLHKYGAVIQLERTVSDNLTAKSVNADKTYIFLQGDAGRVEIGSGYTAGNMLMVNGSKNTLGDGGCVGSWSSYANTTIADVTVAGGSVAFIKGEKLYSDAYAGTLKLKEGQRVISYYTPRMEGLQAGISYIPDAVNNGQDTTIKTHYLQPAKNILNGGVNFDKKFGKDQNVRLRVGMVADYAAGKLDVQTTTPINTPKVREDLFSYHVGVAVNCREFGVSAGYGNWGKSLNEKASPFLTQEPTYASFAGSYSNEIGGLSISHFRSDINANTLRVTSATLAGNVAPGAEVYGTVAWFKQTSAKVAHPQNEGTVYLTGIKVAF